jgi:putative transposase
VTYRWRAVDHEGKALDIVAQRGRDNAAAVKQMRKLLKKQGFAPTASRRRRCDRIQRRSRSLVWRPTRVKPEAEQPGGGSHQPVRRLRERCSGPTQQDLLSASSSCMPPSTTRSMFNAI